MYVQAQNLGGLGEFDWQSLLETAVKGYATVQTVKSQNELMQKQMDLQAQQQQNALVYAYNPQYSGAYVAQPQNSSMVPLLMIGGAALLVLFLMKG